MLEEGEESEENSKNFKKKKKRYMENPWPFTSISGRDKLMKFRKSQEEAKKRKIFEIFEILFSYLV
jgi:hypothetical protein